MRSHVRAPASTQVVRGTKLAFKRASAVKTCKRRVVVVRAQDDNLFAKIGTTIVRAGTTFVNTITGTQKVSKRKGPVDEKVVFVAGATGRLGSRIVQECLRAGLTVRAGIRDADKGDQLIEFLRESLSDREIKRLKLVEYDLFDAESIGPAIGNAGLVACAIGADEKKVFDTTGPKRVDGQAAISLVQTAARQGVVHFLMVTSLGTTKFGWPASALNLFWGVLYHKKLAEQALQTSGMAYTIVRPGGMERPKDDFKETHSVVLAPRDSLFGGQVSRLQVAELAASCLTSRELSENKTLEVIAEVEAPEEDYEALLEQVPQEVSMEELREKKAMIDDARNKARLVAQELEELEAEVAQAQEQKIIAENIFSDARTALQNVGKESRDALRGAEASEQQIEALEAALQDARRQEAAAKAVLDVQRRKASSYELLSRKEIDEIQYPILNPGVERSKPAPAAGLFGLFGGAKAEPVVEEEEEEVEEEAPAPAAPRGGLFSIFGGPKAAPQEEVVEEEEEEEEEAPAPAPAAPKGGLFGFFGGNKAAEREEAAAVEEEEEEAPPVPAPKETQAAEKSAGLFGLFRQEVTYAEDAPGAPPVVRPSEEQVQRAVTKRGGRRSVRELIPRKSQQEEEEQSVAKATPVQVEKPGVEQTKDVKPNSPGFLAGLFGGSQAASEEAAYADAQPGDANYSSNSAPTAAARQRDGTKSAAALVEKKAAEAPQQAPPPPPAAVKPPPPPPPPPAAKPPPPPPVAAKAPPPPPVVEKPPPPPPVAEKPPPPPPPPAPVAEKPKPAASEAKASAGDGANHTQSGDDAAEARRWIENWRAKNKVKVNA